MALPSSCASSTSGTCWICLQDGDQDDVLATVCKCPRSVHPQCMARWQLQMAGRQEEKRCRFCDQDLPDWRPVLTPDNLTPQVPLVSVHYKGACYRLRIKPGPEGLRNFRRELQRITGLTMLECMQITFQCKSPDAAAQELCFKGMSAFDAAMHCASVSAAERLNRPASGTPSRDPSNRPSVATAAAAAPPPSPSPPAADAAATTSSAPLHTSSSAPPPAPVRSTSCSGELESHALPAGVEVTRVSMSSSTASESESQLSSGDADSVSPASHLSSSSAASDSDGASSVGEPGCIIVPTVPGVGSQFEAGRARSARSGHKSSSPRPGHLATMWSAVRKWLA